MLPSEFVPSQDQSRVMIRLQTAVGSDISETDSLLQKAEDIVRAHPEVTQTFSFVGGMGGGGGVNSGMIYLTLVPPGERKMSQADFSAVIRRELNAIPGVRAVIQDTLPAGLHRPARLPGRVLGPRLRLGPARRR